MLDPKKADLFHRLVARLPFASKRARPDIQVTVAFLCARVKALTEEESKNWETYWICQGNDRFASDPGIGRVRNNDLECQRILHHTRRYEKLYWSVIDVWAGKCDIYVKETEVGITKQHRGRVDRPGRRNDIRHVGKFFFEEQARNLSKNSVLKNLGKRLVIKQDNTSAIQLERNGK